VAEKLGSGGCRFIAERGTDKSRRYALESKKKGRSYYLDKRGGRDPGKAKRKSKTPRGIRICKCPSVMLKKSKRIED